MVVAVYYTSYQFLAPSLGCLEGVCITYSHGQPSRHTDTSGLCIFGQVLVKCLDARWSGQSTGSREWRIDEFFESGRELRHDCCLSLLPIEVLRGKGAKKVSGCELQPCQFMGHHHQLPSSRLSPCFNCAVVT